jgi:hypothetical protein
MATIRLVNLLVAITQRMQKAGCFKPVQFKTYGICGFPEFCFKAPEVSPGAAVKEKLPQKLYPRFRSNKGINHRVRFGLMSNKFTRSFVINKSYFIFIVWI